MCVGVLSTFILRICWDLEMKIWYTPPTLNWCLNENQHFIVFSRKASPSPCSICSSAVTQSVCLVCVDTQKNRCLLVIITMQREAVFVFSLSDDIMLLVRCHRDVLFHVRTIPELTAPCTKQPPRSLYCKCQSGSMFLNSSWEMWFDTQQRIYAVSRSSCLSLGFKLCSHRLK